MVYKRYSSPFEEKIPKHKQETPIAPKLEKIEKSPINSGFSGIPATDDIILIALIIILLSAEKGKRDVPMILTLGFLFLIQYIDED